MEVQLQSVLLQQDNICGITDMYYHDAFGRLTFNGYFNLIYIAKRKKYTNLTGITLKIRLRGFKKLILMHDKDDIQEIELDGENEKEYVVPFPYDKYDDGVFAFALIVEDRLKWVLEGMYWGEVDEKSFRKVNIGIDICTYKREGYVFQNLRRLFENIFTQPELEVSHHSHIFLIDNGRSLCNGRRVNELAAKMKDKIDIIQNMNAGGAGGFTRGMIEIMNRKEKEGYSHVLLMDDDAIIQPDLLVRLYGFLTVLKEEWKDMTVGGTLLRQENQRYSFSAGEWWEKGKTTPNQYYNFDLTYYESGVDHFVLEAANEHKLYSGWWCCCYSLNVVREDNLPFQFFVHHDDIEYGIRNRDVGITFLNGICVWHRDVRGAMPGIMSYYDMRNFLIEMVLQKNSLFLIMKHTIRKMAGMLLRYRYKDTKLTCEGVLDFLKGPKWIWELNPEEMNTELAKLADKLSYIDEFREGPVPLVKAGDPIKDYQKHDEVVIWDKQSERAILVKKDLIQTIICMGYILEALCCLLFKYRKAAKEYRRDIGKYTTKEAWEKYLGLGENVREKEELKAEPKTERKVKQKEEWKAKWK